MSHPQYNPYPPGNQSSIQRPFGNPSLQDTSMAATHTVSRPGFGSYGPSSGTPPNAEGRIPPMSSAVNYCPEKSQPSADKNMGGSIDRPRDSARFLHNPDHQSFSQSGSFNSTQKDGYLAPGTGTSPYPMSSKAESSSNSLDWLLSLKKTPVSTNEDHRFYSPSQKDHDVPSIPGLGDIDYLHPHQAPVAAETSTLKYSPESAGNILMQFGLEKEDLEYFASFPEDQMTPSNLPNIFQQIRIEKAKRAKVAVESKSYPESQPLRDPRRPESLGSPAGPSALVQPKVIDYGHSSKYVSQIAEELGIPRHRGTVSSDVGPSLDAYKRSSQHQQPLSKDMAHFSSSSPGSAQSPVSSFAGSASSYGSYRSDLTKTMHHQQNLEDFVLPKTDTDRRTIPKTFPSSADRLAVLENKPSYTEFRSTHPDQHGLVVPGPANNTGNNPYQGQQFSQNNLGQVQQRQQNQPRLPQKNQQVEVQKNPLRLQNQQGQVVQNQPNLGQLAQRQQNQLRLPQQSQQVEGQKNPPMVLTQQGQMLQNQQRPPQQNQQRPPQQNQQRPPQQNQQRPPQQNRQVEVQKNQSKAQNQPTQVVQRQQNQPRVEQQKQQEEIQKRQSRPQDQMKQPAALGVGKGPPPLSSTRQVEQQRTVAPLVSNTSVSDSVSNTTSTRPSIGFKVAVPPAKPALSPANPLETLAPPVKRPADGIQISKGAPTQDMMLDYAAITPDVFPHTCSLCSKEFRDLRGWISHQNSSLHLKNCRLLRTKYPYWDGKIVSEPRAAEKNAKTSSSTGSTSQQHQRKTRNDSRSRSRSPRRRGRRSRSKSPRRSRYTRRSRSRSRSRSQERQRRRRDERRSSSRKPDNRKTSSTRSDESRSSPKQSEKRTSSPRRSRERRRSSERSSQSTQAAGAEELVKKLLETTAAQSEEPNLEAMVKSLAPALLAELSKMKSSSSSSTTTTKKKEKTSASTKTDDPDPTAVVTLSGVTTSIPYSDLFDAMEKFGKTTAVVIYRSRLEATVHFEKEEDAKKVKSQKNITVNGVELDVDKKHLEREKKTPESENKSSKSSRQSTTTPKKKPQASSARSSSSSKAPTKKETSAGGANKDVKSEDSTVKSSEAEKTVLKEKLTATVKEGKSEVTRSSSSETSSHSETSKSQKTDSRVGQESGLVKVKSEGEPESTTGQEKGPAPSAEVSPETLVLEVKTGTLAEMNLPAGTRSSDPVQVQDPLDGDVQGSRKTSHLECDEVTHEDNTQSAVLPDVLTEPQMVCSEVPQPECEEVIQSEGLGKSTLVEDSVEKTNSCPQDQTKENMDASSAEEEKKPDKDQEETRSSTSVKGDLLCQGDQMKSPDVPEELNKSSDDNQENQADIYVMDLDSFQILDSIDSTEDDNEDVKPSDREEGSGHGAEGLEDQSANQKETKNNKRTSDGTKVTKAGTSPRTRSSRNKGETTKEDKAVTQKEIHSKTEPSEQPRQELKSKEDDEKMEFKRKTSAEAPVVSASERSGRRTRGRREDTHKTSTKSSDEEPSYKILDSVGDEPEESMVVTRSTRERRGRSSTNDGAVERTKKESTGTRQRRTPVRGQQKKEEKTSKKTDATTKEKKEGAEDDGGSEENQVGKKEQPSSRGQRGRSRRDVKTLRRHTEALKKDPSEGNDQEEEPLYQILDSVEDDQMEEELTSTESSTVETTGAGEPKDVSPEKQSDSGRTTAEMDENFSKIDPEFGPKTQELDPDNLHAAEESSTGVDKACPEEETSEGFTSENTVRDVEEDQECSPNEAAQNQEIQPCQEEEVEVEEDQPRKRLKLELETEVEDDSGLTGPLTATEVQDFTPTTQEPSDPRENVEQCPEEAQEEETESQLNLKTLTVSEDATHEVSKLDMSSEETPTSVAEEPSHLPTQPQCPADGQTSGAEELDPLNASEIPAEPGQQIPEDWCEAGAEDLKPENQSPEQQEEVEEEKMEEVEEGEETKQIKRTCEDDFEGLDAKRPRCPSVDVTLPAFTPNNPLGQEFVVPKSGFFCNLCRIFYLSESTAKEMHCSSRKHYHNLKKYYETRHLESSESPRPQSD